MANKNATMILSGIPLHYTFRFEDTIKWFKWHMIACDLTSEENITLSDELFELRRKNFAEGVSNSYMEYRTLVEPTAIALIRHGSFIMHAAAFSWEGYAWLITAPSGTGKTTQYLNWKRLYQEKVGIICGDMPVLRPDKTGQIRVYPSPWNGKERFGFENRMNYPLGGIVYLVQSDHNLIKPINYREMILPLWNQFIGFPETESQIRSKESFLNQLFSNYPIWMCENKGDDESTMLLHDIFGKHLYTK